MYCLKCSKEIDKNALFCPYCGAKQNNETDTDKEKTNINDFEDTENFGYQSSNKKRPSNKIVALFVILGIVIIAIIVAIIIAIANGGRTTINLNNYLVVYDYGYDGYGSVEYSIDTQQLRSDYIGKLKLTSEGNNNYAMSSQVTRGNDPVEIIIDDISVSADYISDLSNGDKVVFTWDSSAVKIIETYVNVSLKADNYIYTVGDLGEVEHDDFFNYISVDFSGIAPNGTATLSVNCDWLDVYDFSLSKSSELSNGDTVTVTLDDYSINRIINDYGKAPIEDSKLYTVEGLSYYITSLSDIPEDELELMKNKSVSFLEDESNGWEYSTLDSTEFLGCYLAESAVGSEGNRIYLLYKTTETTSKDGDTKTYDRYWYNCFEDGLINEDGVFTIYLENSFQPVAEYRTFYGLTGEGFEFKLGDNTFYCSGYETYEELKYGIETDIVNDNEKIVDCTLPDIVAQD